MIITREEALMTLNEITDSEIIDECLCDKLNEIAFCIALEQDGKHIWGADVAEAMGLLIDYSKDIDDDKLGQRLVALNTKYRFTPSEFESGNKGLGCDPTLPSEAR